MEGGDRMLMAAGLTAAVVVGAFVLWGPGGSGARPRARRGRVAGLHNLGRTCFLNTLLQAMAACPLFAQWLKRNASASSANNSMITTLSTVIEVVNGSHETARGLGPVCPLGVLRCLGALGWVVPEDQHDAHELLHVLLACVDEETQAQAKKMDNNVKMAYPVMRSPEGTLQVIPEEGFPVRSVRWSSGATQRPGSVWCGLGVAARAMPGAPFVPGRSVSSPATPDSPLVRCARSLSQATIPLPGNRAEKSIAAAGVGSGSTLDVSACVGGSTAGLAKGVSRSFCQLDRLGRPEPPQPPPPQPPFHGATATRLQCTICEHKSPIRYDKFDSISLQLGELPAPLSVVGLLRAFTAPEMLKGVACSRCNEGRDSSLSHTLTAHIKSLSIGKLPTCLCLHIGRTQWGPAGLSKRSDHVAFQETLSLAPFTSTQPPKVEEGMTSLLMSQSVGSSSLWQAGRAATPVSGGDGWRAMYRLQAVVVHVGGPRSGHFVTYRRGNAFEAKRWFYTSDTVVHEVSLDEVLGSAAYMLFYEKMSAAGQKPGVRMPHA